MPPQLISGVSRRKMLSVLGALPLFSGMLLKPPAASAQTATSGTSLPSWNEGATKESILDFVAAVTGEGSPDCGPPAERIATFDNHVTFWVEHRMYTELASALHRTMSWV